MPPRLPLRFAYRVIRALEENPQNNGAVPFHWATRESVRPSIRLLMLYEQARLLLSRLWRKQAQRFRTSALSRDQPRQRAASYGARTKYGKDAWSGAKDESVRKQNLLTKAAYALSASCGEASGIKNFGMRTALLDLDVLPVTSPPIGKAFPDNAVQRLGGALGIAHAELGALVVAEIEFGKVAFQVLL